MSQRSGEISKKTCRVYDWYDAGFRNPRELSLATDHEVGLEFDHDTITYRIEDAITVNGENAVILRAIRQRIDDTNTQIVHKCPARTFNAAKLSRGDVLKLRGDLGVKKASHLTSSRVRLSSSGTVKCPDCGCEFWKADTSRPGPIFVKRMFKKTKP